MIIRMHTGGVAMTNCFLAADELTREAVLFDAPDHTASALLNEVDKNGWKLIGLWLTHGHFDHFADHQVVKRHCPECRVLIHKLDAPKASQPEVQTELFGLPFAIPPLKPDGYVEDGQKLKFGNIEVTVIHTPGHSPGHVAYHIPAEEVIVGGDLIIGGSVGRTDLPDSDHEQLQASIRRVMALPPSTRLLGGHGPATTLAHERQTNFWVQEALEMK